MASDEPVRLTDPTSIRALAHPARLAVIEELYGGRRLTATECGELVGLSASAMSYHLRSLEKAGIVERAPAGSDGRERPWQAAGSDLIIDPSGSALAQAAGNALRATVLERLAVELEAWSRRPAETGEWKGAGGITSGQYWLRADEAREVERGLREQLRPYETRDAGERPADARRFRVAAFVFPIDDAPVDDAPVGDAPVVRSEDDDPA